MTDGTPTPQELAEYLIDSARYGDLDDINAVLAAGVSADVTDDAGRTALHMAAANGHLECVRQLLSANANVHAKNQEGNTALHWACLNGHTEVVRALLEYKARASELNNAQRTPVDEALDKGHEEAMEVIRSYNNSSGDGSADPSSAQGLTAGPDGEECDDIDESEENTEVICVGPSEGTHTGTEDTQQPAGAAGPSAPATPPATGTN